MTTSITATLNLEQISVLIEEVTAAEKITKHGLSLLSRELLAFAYEHGDISPINSLLGCNADGKFRLTPINWRIAVQYFDHFVAFTSNFEKDIKKFAVKGEGKRVAMAFNKKSKAKFDAKLPLVEAWLLDTDNDIWSWSNEIVLEAKAPDFIGNMIKSFQAALDEERGGFTFIEVMQALILDEDTNVSLGDLREMLNPPAEVTDIAA